MHNIATNKNILGGFSKQFEKIFSGAGISLDDGINKIILRGHANVRHTKEHHQYVLRRLTDATQGLKGGSQQYRNAVSKTLEELRRELLDSPGMIGWTVF
jgi:A nuclease family of the HNH/ENDO VII superfamily with conserved AHH